jgi:hypothetical protein
MGMQLWKVLIFGAVQGKKHNGLWEGNTTSPMLHCKILHLL